LWQSYVHLQPAAMSGGGVDNNGDGNGNGTGNGDGTGTGGGDSPYVGSGVEVTGSTLKDKLIWLRANAQSNTSYKITVDKDETLSIDWMNDEDYYTDLTYAGKSNIKIWLTGGKTITSESILPLYLFQVGSGVTLILSDITLQDDYVEVKGALEIKTGAKVDSVWMDEGGTFTIDNGEVDSIMGGSGTFTINGGKIVGMTGVSGTININGGEISGGIYLNKGTINMSGGKITGGRVTLSSNATFTMDGGEISGTTVNSSTISFYGGGVYVSSGTTFIMNGGEIFNNQIYNATSSDGGGVYVTTNGTFTMTGGKIYSNSAKFGGGIYVTGGTFTMTGGEIYSNTALQGGGVYVNSGTFKKTGGIITGFASDEATGNKAPSGYHAAYVSSGKIRNTTAGVNDNLDSTLSGSAGGWE